MSPHPALIGSWLISLILISVAAGIDVRDRRIPNEIVVAVAAIGVTLGIITRPGQIWLNLLVAFIVFCALGILSHHRLIGGGDVKLISAVTLLVPPDRVGHLLIAIALAGGALSCCYLAARYGLKKLSPTPSSAQAVAGRGGGFVATVEAEGVRIAAGDPMPYAVAILGGVILYATGGLFPCFARSCS
jgi:prepilin peptidase CpaA